MSGNASERKKRAMFSSDAGSSRIANRPKLQCVDDALHENEIEPAVKFSPDLVEMRDLLEAKAFVQTDRRRVGSVDASDHHVFSQRLCVGKQGLDEMPSHSGAAAVSSHVNGVLDRMPISRPSPAPIRECRKPDDVAFRRDRDLYGKAALFLLREPGHAVVE
jgi:hypothetical protein